MIIFFFNLWFDVPFLTGNHLLVLTQAVRDEEGKKPKALQPPYGGEAGGMGQASSPVFAFKSRSRVLHW